MAAIKKGEKTPLAISLVTHEVVYKGELTSHATKSRCALKGCQQEHRDEFYPDFLNSAIHCLLYVLYSHTHIHKCILELVIVN